jgi:hypothetical protein
VDRLRHLLEIGSLLEAGASVRVDAVGTLHGGGDGERGESLLALTERSLFEDGL